MKLLDFFYRVSKRSALAIVLVIAFVPVLLSAQERSLQVISDHSTAKLFLGTAENPTSFNIGIARVSGEVQLKPEDVSASHFNFTIYAANATANSNNETIYRDQPVISFHSENVTQRDDGNLEVRGQLTVTQIFREAVLSSGEDYSGPVYGPPTQFRTSHEATFVFAALNGSAPDALLTGAARVNGEAFPELSLSIQQVAWPVVIDDATYVTPSTVSEDYSGATYTGTVHEPSPSPVVLVQPGEDYAGIQQVPPAGDQVTIQLDLSLAHADRSSVATDTRKSDAQRPEAQ